jgi:gliding motility-associated-like protein
MKKLFLIAGILVLFCSVSRSQVVINEIMVMPGTNYIPGAGGDNLNTSIQAMFNYNATTNTYSGQEWVEIYNSSCSAVDVGCWVLETNVMDGTTAEGAFIIPPGTIIPSNGFLVIGGPNATGVNMPINTAALVTTNSCSGSPSNLRWHLNNGAGYLVLHNSSLQIVDAIYWDQAAANLQTGGEFDNDNGCMPYVSSCNHPVIIFPMAKNISGIEYIGDCSSSAVGTAFIGKSAYRSQDGGITWGLGGNATPGQTNCPGCPPITGLSVQLAVNNATCGQNNGSITASVNGGSQPISYLWSNNATTSSISNLTAGVYSVTVTDANGCQGILSDTVTNGSGLSVSVSLTDATCGQANGTATANPTGGSNPYSYQWSSNPSHNSSVLQNVGAGNYSITVTDAQGCSAMNGFAINSSGGPVISVTNIAHASCGQNDGAVTINVQGGQGPYTYLWNTGQSQSTPTLTNLPPGVYSVTVTDAAGCTSIISATINSNNSLTVNISSTDAHCDRSDGEATATVNGITGNYSYIWDTDPPSYSASINNVPSGNYTVTVSGGGCTTSATCFIGNKPGPQANFTIKPRIVDNYDGEGTVTFTDLSEGSINLWQWTFGDGDISDQQNVIHNYDPGNYYVTLTVIDQFGCIDIATDSVKVYDIFTVFIPNAFTPIAPDGRNDFFGPKGNFSSDGYHLYIYDRWGKLFFETNNPEDSWNGTISNSGTVAEMVTGIYVYLVILKDWQGLIHHYKGFVTLL